MAQPNTKIGAIKLVRDFYGAKMDELKALPQKDRDQLASAIARQQGLTQDEVSFVMVDY